MSGLTREMIIHPGFTLKEVLEERRISQLELAHKSGVSEKHISSVLNGQYPISIHLAKQLEYSLGINSQFWINLQKVYDKEMCEFEKLH